MPTTPSTINYYIAADGTLRDGQAGSIAQTPRIYYGTEYAVTLSFPPSTIAEGDQLQVALNRTRTFFSSASATGDAPVAAVAKHDVTAEEATAQAVTLTLSTNTRAMIDQVNGIDHPVRGFFGVHLLRGQSFVTLAVADAFMMSVESGPDAISPSLPVVDYPTREEAEALTDRSEAAAERAEQAAAGIVPPLQLSAPPTTSTVGSVGQLATWHDAENNIDHLYHLVYITTSENATLYHWEECVLESQRNVANGFAGLTASGKIPSTLLSLPKASTTALGAIMLSNSFGTHVDAFGALYLVRATDAEINAKTHNFRPIVPSNLDYAVRSVSPLITTIAPATDTFNLLDASATTNNHSHTYRHVPTTAPTYVLPSISNSGITHDITVEVDFSNVASCSFKDAGGSPVFLQKAIKPTLGDIYVFKCEWHSRWFVMPIKVRSFAEVDAVDGLIQVTDAVGGNARSLKMTAPRSVVVNQLVQNGDFSNGTTGWTGYNTTLSASNNILSVTYALSGNKNVCQNIPFVNGHTYIATNETKDEVAGMHVMIFAAQSVNLYATPSNAWKRNTLKFTAVADGGSCYWMLYNEAFVTETTSQMRNVMVVDLTQYFNDDQTLIDSIQSWDDLVAYDSRFAQYVAYNTGEVVGVQPQVKVTGKNLCDPSIFTANGGVLQEDGSYYFANAGALTNKILFRNSGLKEGTITISGQIKYKEGEASAGIVLKIQYTDNTYTLWRGPSGPYDGTYADVTVVSTANKIVKYIAGNHNSPQTSTNLKNIQIEWASAATTYEPYHDGGTATAPEELFAVGTAADEFEAVSGTTEKAFKQVDLSTLTWTTGEGTYSATIADIKPSTQNILLPNGYAGTMSGTTLTITASATPSGTAIYESATHATSITTPAQISLQAGNNTVMQTDGGRTADFEMMYENNPALS